MTGTGIIIVAGGIGTRMGGEIPKQFLCLDGRPLLMHTIDRFAEALPEAKRVVVLPENQIREWQSLCLQYDFQIVHTVVSGGETRFHSVKNGLAEVTDCDYIGVHDGVRPLITRNLITRVLEAAQDFGAAIPAVPVSDSLRETVRCQACEDPSRIIDSKPVDRSRFLAVQTPQFFRAGILLRSYGQDYTPKFTDDASVVEAGGSAVMLIPGDPANLKLTTPVDLILAQALLRSDND